MAIDIVMLESLNWEIATSFILPIMAFRIRIPQPDLRVYLDYRFMVA